MDSAKKIATVCDEVKKLLLEKNAKYGDSALNPVRVFSHADPAEQIRVRIDDKLSRLSRGAGSIKGDEDTLKDLVGYLVLLMIATRSDLDWDLDDDTSTPEVELADLRDRVEKALPLIKNVRALIVSMNACRDLDAAVKLLHLGTTGE